MNFIKLKDLGFEKNQTLIFTFQTDDTKRKMQPFINDLQQLPEIKAVSKCNNYPSQFVFNDIAVFLEGGDLNNSEGVQYMSTDEHFIKAMLIRLLSGRDFRLNDSGKVIVNEAFTKNWELIL